MTPKQLLQFSVGTESAIRSAGSNRALLGIGFLLVITAAVARNYDQFFILEKPWWPFAPAIFSAFSGLFVYWFVFRKFIRDRSETSPAGFWDSFPRFLALFWMTAPMAWLYAIPVERFLTSYQSALANVGLLLVVSAWRVWLMSRILVVQLNVPMRAALRQVMLAASVELVLLSLWGGLRVLEIMGGLVHSPERIVVGNVVGFGFWAGVAGLLLSVGLGRNLPDLSGRQFPASTHARFPAWLVLIVLIWGAVALVPQQELQRNHHLEQLLKERAYTVALKFLSTHERSDFSPSRRIAPDPYTYPVLTQLPSLFGAMDGSEASWVRTEYLGHLEVMLRHYRPPEADANLELFEGLARIPEGSAWVTSRTQTLSRYAQRSISTMEPEQAQKLRLVLKQLAIEIDTTSE